MAQHMAVLVFDERKDIMNTIEGRNPVFEALSAGVSIDKILVSETAQRGALGKLLKLAKEKGINVQFVNPKKISEVSSTEVNQGIVAFCAEADYVSVDEILNKAEKEGHPPFIIICDEISDPHNLGAIIRTANCVGADGVIIPKNRSVGLTATVNKTSAGALNYTPVAKVTNLAKTIDELKKQGVWVTGADMDGENDLFSSDMLGAIAIVVGAEGKGISRLVKEKCDFLVRIPMCGEINSLNASVAASLMMYEVLRTRSRKG